MVISVTLEGNIMKLCFQSAADTVESVMVVGFQPKGRKRFVYTRSLEIEEKDSRAL